MIERFLPDGSHESLGVGIQIETAWGQFHWLHPGGLENTLELGRIQWVAVMDQVLLASEEASVTAYVSGDLLHPGTVGLGADAEDLDLAGGQLDGKEHQVANQSAFDEQLHGEGITRRQDIPVALDTLLPGCLAGQVWLGVKAVLQKDVLDRGFADLVSEVDDVIPDSRVAPVRILLFESDHEINDLPRDPRQAWVLAVLAAVILLGEESAVPTEDRVWREQDRRCLPEFSRVRCLALAVSLVLRQSFSRMHLSFSCYSFRTRACSLR